MVCAMITQAVGDAIFLRRVGSLDDNLKPTGKLPKIQRASQWPIDIRDIQEVAAFFEDGRLRILLDMVGFEMPVSAFKKAAMTLPVDHSMRAELRPIERKVKESKKEKLLSQKQQKSIQPKNTWKFNYKPKNESTKTSTINTQDPSSSGNTPSSPVQHD